MRRGNVFSRICLSVCNAQTFKSLNLESLYFVCRYICRISRSSLYIKVIGSRSGSQEQKKLVYVFCSRVVCLEVPSSKRQSYYYISTVPYAKLQKRSIRELWREASCEWNIEGWTVRCRHYAQMTILLNPWYSGKFRQRQRPNDLKFLEREKSPELFICCCEFL